MWWMNIWKQVMQTKWGTIEKCDIKKITDWDIRKLQKIEQDSWGYFVWEYVLCKTCENIDSKSDIYSSLDPDYSKKSICELEEIHWCDDIKCTTCWSDTEFIRWVEWEEKIRSRLFDTADSYVSLLKDTVGSIIWFAYWYVDTFEWVYEKDLSFSFKKWFLEEYTSIRKQTVFTVSWICVEEKCKSVQDVYNLIKFFVNSVDEKYDEVLGVYESILWSLTYKLFTQVGGETLLLPEKWRHFYKKNLDLANTITDISFHTAMVRDYKKIADIWFFELMKRKKSEE